MHMKEEEGEDLRKENKRFYSKKFKGREQTGGRDKRGAGSRR